MVLPPRLRCNAIANFPPTLDAGPRRKLRRGPATDGTDSATDKPLTVPWETRMVGKAITRCLLPAARGPRDLRLGESATEHAGRRR